MELNEYMYLDKVAYEFITYMDEVIVGVPYIESISGFRNCYIIPHSKIREYNDSKSPVEEKIASGLLIPINPDVIDIFTKIN